MKPRRWILLGTFIAAVLLWASHERAERAPRPVRRTLEVEPDLVRALEAGGFDEEERATLSGRVEWAEGGGAAEVMVAAVGSHTSGFTWTDARGEFHIDALQLGEVELILVAPRAPNLIARATVGGEGETVLRLPPQRGDVAMISEIERAPLTGTVEATFDDSPSGFVVMCVPDEDPSGASDLPLFAAALEGRMLRSTLCDEAGEFAFEDLGTGAYRLVVLPPWAEGGTWPALIDRTIVHREGLEPVVLRCQSGRITGLLRERDDKPIPGARVEVRDAGRPERLWPPALTAADGRFVVDHLPEGTYRTRVSTGNAKAEQTVRVSALRATEVDFGELVLFDADADAD